MKKRIYIVLVTLLSTSMLVLGYRLLFSLPANPTSLILNEKSYLEIINENDFQEILAKRIKINLEPSRIPRVVEAKESANKITDGVIQVHQQMNEAVSLYRYTDSVRRKLSRVSDVIGGISALGPATFPQKSEFDRKLVDPGLYSGPDTQLGLPILLLESDLLYALSTQLDSLHRIAESVTLKFDRLTDINPNSGPPWIKGQIAFNPPALMNLTQTERVLVRISRKYAVELAESMVRKESVVSDSLPVGDIMMVKLLGDDFNIVAYDEEEQGVTNDGYTQWEFDVTPKSSGNHDLHVKAGIVYYVPNLGPAKKYFPVYDKTIHVEVSIWQMVAGFAVNRWEFLISTIFIPLVAWGYSRWRNRGKQAA